ncbi:MAG: hypothetical protein JKY37_17170 [Nannocystaceae bacterium]|nr:hypothetical protein [Nannocystaceae bacterium]
MRWWVLVALAGCGRGPWFIAEEEPRACGSAEIFASEVLSYEPGYAGAPPVHPDVLDPQSAIGAPDWNADRGFPGVGAVSLGRGGRLELGFSRCKLGHDGTRDADIRIYEVGPAVERVFVFVRASPGSMGALDSSRQVAPTSPYFEVGELLGGVTDVDLDGLVLDGGTASFDAILFEDGLQGAGSDAAWGADIDAVELLSVAGLD